MYLGSHLDITEPLVAQTVKHLPAVLGDLGLIPASGRASGEGNGSPLQYSYLENPMDGGACWVTVHRSHKELDTTEQLHFTSLHGSEQG